MSRTALVGVLGLLIAAACSEAPAADICTGANLSYEEDVELTVWLRTDGRGVSTAAISQCPDVYMHILLSETPPQQRRQFWESIREWISDSDRSTAVHDFLIEGRGRVIPEQDDYAVPRIILSQVRLTGPTTFPERVERALSLPQE